MSQFDAKESSLEASALYGSLEGTQCNHNITIQNERQEAFRLTEAIENYNTNELKIILEYGGNPNQILPIEIPIINTENWGTVQLAAHYGSIDCLNTLSEYGATFNDEKADVIGISDKAGHRECSVFLKGLLEKRLREEEQRKKSLHDLERACSKEVHSSTLSMLLNALATTCNPVLWKFANNYTPITMVCREGDLVKLIELTQRTSPAIFGVRTDDQCKTPLHVACEANQIEIIKFLIYYWPQLLNAKSKNGLTAIMTVTEYRHFELAQMLIDITSTKEGVMTFLNNYPQPTSNISRNIDVLPLIDINTQNDEGNTVLHIATIMKNIEIIQILTDLKSIKLNIKNVQENTALHIAVLNRSYKIVKRLLTKRANSKIKSYYGDGKYHPLTIATMMDDIEMVKLLLQYKAHSGCNEASRQAQMRSYKKLIPLLLGCHVFVDEELLDVTNDSYVDIDQRRPEFAIYMNFSEYALKDLEKYMVEEALNYFSNTIMETNPQVTIPFRNLMNFVTKLDISNNQLTKLPDCLFELKNLFNLNISNNKIDQIQVSEENWKQLSILTMENNLLEDVPAKLFELPQLRTLNISQNNLYRLPCEMWIAPVLNKLILKNNKLNSLPNEIPIYAKSNDDRETNSEERRVPGAANEEKFQSRTTIFTKGLDFDFSKVTSSVLPKSLISLNLANNFISELPTQMQCLCPQLEVLNLSNNKISAIDLMATMPSSIYDLNLSKNQIEVINCSNEVKYSVGCERSLAENKDDENDILLCVHKSGKILNRLSRIDLSENLLRSVNLNGPVEEDKKNATLKDVEQKRLPKDGKEEEEVICPSLTCIYLGKNNLDHIPDSICNIVSLTCLHVNENRILELPPKLGQLTNLFQLNLEGLQLVFPPQNILDKNVKEIIGFLWSLQKDARPYHRLRLMLVGMQQRGKTSLLSKLVERGTYRATKSVWSLMKSENKKNRNINIATPGISISDWTYMPKAKPLQKLSDFKSKKELDFQAITFMIWDFGGQDEFHPTHQCFMTRRAIYLVFWRLTDMEKGADELQAWLLNIQARAPNSPVIIVGTHLDLLKKEDKKKIPNWRKRIFQKYGKINVNQKPGLPQIIEAVEVSTLTGEGVDVLREWIYYVASHLTVTGTLYKEANNNNELGRKQKLLMDQLVPSAYLLLEDCIKKVAIKCFEEDRPKILEETVFFEYLTNFVQNKIRPEDLQRETQQAVKFLHDNGFLLHYEDAQLQNLYFIDPQWLCDLLAQVITVKEINPYIKDDGFMPITSMNSLFGKQKKNFPIKYIDKYIQLLIKFEIALKIDSDTLLIPSFLPELPEDKIWYKDLEIDYYPTIRLYILVDYVSGGFWPRLITRILSDISIIEAAIQGCKPVPIKLNLKWVKWKTGLRLVFSDHEMDIYLAAIYQKMSDQLGFDKHLRNAYICYEGDFQQYTPREFDTHSLVIEIPDNYPTLIKYFVDYGEVSEKTHNIMRAMLLSKLSTHMKLLFDDWYQGICTTSMLFSCPACLAGEKQIEIKRYHKKSDKRLTFVEQQYKNNPIEIIRKRNSTTLSLENVHFFTYSHCLVQTQKSVYLDCPNHGALPMSIIAPNAVFMHLGADILIPAASITLHKFIGKGSYGKVYKGKICSEGDPVRGYAHGDSVAVKMMVNYNEKKIDDAISKKPYYCSSMSNFGITDDVDISYRIYEEVALAHEVVFKEASYLISLKNPYIVSLVGICLSPISLILELAPLGSLEYILEEYSKRGLHLTQKTCHKSALQIALGIQYIHKQNIIYRDLKASNVLVWKFPLPTETENNEVVLKISDYGVSQFASFGGVGIAGTAGYMAPEILFHGGFQTYNSSVDIFSFGMTIYELITLHPPFRHLQSIQANQEVVLGNRPQLTSKDTMSSILMRELMVWCWQQDPTKRPSSDQVVTALNSWEFLALQGGIKLHKNGITSCVCIYQLKNKTIDPEMSVCDPNREVVSELGPSLVNSTRIDDFSDSGKTSELTTPKFLDSLSLVTNSPIKQPKSALKNPVKNPCISLDECHTRSESICHNPLEAVKPTWEIWTCGGGKYFSQLIILKYSNRFTSVDDIHLGSSCVLCMQKIGDSILIGFDMGFVQVFDAPSRKLTKKVWIELGVPVIKIEYNQINSHILIVLSNGSIFSYLSEAGNFETPYSEENSLLPFVDPEPTAVLNEVASTAIKVEIDDHCFLWVSQNAGTIAVVDAITWDQRLIMDPIAGEYYYRGCNHPYTKLVAIPERAVVYGIKVFTMIITRWNAISLNCEAECNITSLSRHWSELSKASLITCLQADSNHIYIGLNIGIMLQLSYDFKPISYFYGHEGSIGEIAKLDYYSENLSGEENKMKLHKKVLTCGLNYHGYFERNKENGDEQWQNLLVWELN